MNRLLLCILALSVAMDCWCRNDWFDPPQIMEKGLTAVSADSEAVDCATIHVRMAMADSKENSWGIVWNYKDDTNWNKAVYILPADSKDNSLYEEPVYLELTTMVHGVPTTERHQVKGIDTHGGYNSLKLVYSDGMARLMGGASEAVEFFEVPFDPQAGKIAVFCTDKAKCQRIQVQMKGNEAYVNTRFADVETLIQEIKESADPMESLWEYLDRNVDATKAVIGGRYKLATVKNGERYDIVYLDGAEINSDRWQPMTVKGRLIPTIFVDNYDMVWYDSYGREISGDSNASLSADRAIITLRFPEIKAEVRLRRLP